MKEIKASIILDRTLYNKNTKYEEIEILEEKMSRTGNQTIIKEFRSQIINIQEKNAGKVQDLLLPMKTFGVVNVNSSELFEMKDANVIKIKKWNF